MWLLKTFKLNTALTLFFIIWCCSTGRTPNFHLTFYSSLRLGTYVTLFFPPSFSSEARQISGMVNHSISPFCVCVSKTISFKCTENGIFGVMERVYPTQGTQALQYYFLLSLKERKKMALLPSEHSIPVTTVSPLFPPRFYCSLHSQAMVLKLVEAEE